VNKDEKKKPAKKKLVLRQGSIRTLDATDLSVVAGGFCVPPDGGVPPAPTLPR